MDDERHGVILWETGETRSPSGVLKLSITDNGTGMSGEEMIRYINTLSSSGSHQVDGNYGVGAKITAATRNPAGLLSLSWKSGRAGEAIQMVRDASGQYGLLSFGDEGESDFVAELDDHQIPTQIKAFGAGTRIVLMGQRAAVAMGRCGTVLLDGAIAHWWILRSRGKVPKADPTARGPSSRRRQCRRLTRAIKTADTSRISSITSCTICPQGMPATLAYSSAGSFPAPTGSSSTWSRRLATSRRTLRGHSSSSTTVRLLGPTAHQFREKTPEALREFIGSFEAKRAVDDSAIKERNKEVLQLFAVPEYVASARGQHEIDDDDGHGSRSTSGGKSTGRRRDNERPTKPPQPQAARGLKPKGARGDALSATTSRGHSGSSRSTRRLKLQTQLRIAHDPVLVVSLQVTTERGVADVGLPHLYCRAD